MRAQHCAAAQAGTEGIAVSDRYLRSTVVLLCTQGQVERAGLV